jgi:hypothetical protein
MCRGSTYSRAAITAEFFVRLDRCAAFWASGCEEDPAIRTEFTPLAIIAAAFRTAHIPPNERLRAQLIEQRLGIFQIGQVEAFGEPIVDFAQHRARFIAAVGVAEQARKTD